MVVRVVFAPSRDFLVLKWSFEAWPESRRDRMDEYGWLVPCDRKIEEEQNRFDVMSRF